MTTATAEALFIKQVDPISFFPKEASIARMPDDDKKWPEVVLSELHKQLPFMSGMDVSLNFTRIQPQAGYGFGYALVRGQKNAVNLAPKDENQMVKIPIIVADRHLEPFHVFHFESKTLPLTRSRFEEALENPRVFAGIDQMPKTQKSLIDQLYPPYQQRQGFGRVVDGSGMSGSSMGINKTASVMDPHSKTQQGLDLLGLPSTRDFNRKAIATKNVNDALARIKSKHGIKQAQVPMPTPNKPDLLDRASNTGYGMASGGALGAIGGSVLGGLAGLASTRSLAGAKAGATMGGAIGGGAGTLIGGAKGVMSDENRKDKTQALRDRMAARRAARQGSMGKLAQAPTEEQEGLSGKQKALVAGGSLLGLTGAGFGLRKLLKSGVPATVADARKAGEDSAEAFADSIGMGADARKAHADDVAAIGNPAEELPSMATETLNVPADGVPKPPPIQGTADPATVNRLQRQRAARGGAAPTQTPNLQVIDGEKQAQAPAMVQNPMDTLDPGQLKRLATLKQYEGIDRANSQMTSKDKRKQVLDNTAFSAAAGGLLRGGTSFANARNAGNALSAVDMGKNVGKGALTGTALSLLGQGYRAAKGKLREKDRNKEEYAQYLKTATAEDIPNLRGAESEDIRCKTCKFYGSSTETGAGMCNKYSSDVNESMVCDEWEANIAPDKLASYTKYLMGAKQ